MAAHLRTEIVQALRQTRSFHTSTQWLKKKPPKWRDPEDLSWAAPLLEQQSQQKAASADGEQTPHKLHMVTLVKTLVGRPYWEKKTAQTLGLKEKYIPVVHKNTPNVNSQLRAIKHLVRIVPVSLPDGLPTEESDFHNCVLRNDGRLEIKKTLHPRSAEEEKRLWDMDEETVEKQTRKVLENFALSREYFPAKYVYKYNQDGKEFRYNGAHNNGVERHF